MPGKKGLGMWVMSKTVLMVFLLGLLVVLTSILHVYQEKVIEDSARGVVMLWAETANSVVMFRSGSAIWALDKYVLISGGRQKNSIYRDYTAVVTSGGSGLEKRLIFMLAWGDQETKDLDDIEQFATAVSINLPSKPPDEIRAVHFFNGRLDSTNQPVHPEYIEPATGALILRPSMSGRDSDDSLLFYRDEGVLCVASKKLAETNSTQAMRWLAECCKEDPADIPDGSTITDSEGNLIKLPCCLKESDCVAFP